MSFDDNLDRLARLCVGFGLQVKPGQELLITADIGAADLVRRITREAYGAGASNVQVFFADDAITLARFTHGSEDAIETAPGWLFEAMAGAMRNGSARLAIAGGTPGLLAEQDPGKVARANAAQSVAAKPFMEVVTSGLTNWNIVPFVTEGWAKQVYPDLPVAEAVETLWGHVFRALRLDHDDPVAAWQTVFDTLAKRREYLTERAFSALHFEGGGTDLTLGLAKGHVWAGGGLRLADGTGYAPNLPTEEVFTMPDRGRAEGRAVFTKPAVINGTIVEGLVVEFAGGKAVKITADKGEAVAQTYFTSDEGASRLGEVALVPESSPIARSDVLYFNTLFDENAACHIAFGNSYSMNLAPGADREAAGANESTIHMDCMIGGPELSVTGIASDGNRHPIMEKGEFVI
ncbi:aminopeptidase [Maritimibacter fusiformis]|uniref:Aminopeptidase n=1 Tax=Maritimibacter fusiformis TaxID=2603819 RepID=A0A5D0RKT0_9RHOB|nr:aminopeptidase [Maritimibacter fusiformis]TYB82230.1 aminopeptidase [Maritimibacter fusiformis]